MTQEVLKLALEALDDMHIVDFPLEDLRNWNKAINAIKEALAQPEQEPVAHLWECIGRWSAYLVTNGKQANCAPPSWLVDAVNNANTPPQRTWVGLTIEEIASCCRESTTTQLSFAQELEAKLKQKNGYAEEKNT